MESFQAFQGRYGRRDGVLSLIGVLDSIFAINLLVIENPNNDRIYGSIINLHIWAGIWFAAAAVAWISIFRKQDRLGFSFSAAILTSWGVLAASAWLQGDFPNGWLSATFFLVLDGMLLIPASWPEPRNLVLDLVDDTFPDAVVTADDKGTITGWLGSAERMFGWSAEEIVGQSVQQIMPVRYRMAHQRALDRVQQTGKSRLEGRLLNAEALRRDGTEFPVRILIGVHHTDFGMAFSTTISDRSEVV